MPWRAAGSGLEPLPPRPADSQPQAPLTRKLAPQESRAPLSLLPCASPRFGCLLLSGGRDCWSQGKPTPLRARKRRSFAYEPLLLTFSRLRGKAVVRQELGGNPAAGQPVVGAAGCATPQTPPRRTSPEHPVPLYRAADESVPPASACRPTRYSPSPAASSSFSCSPASASTSLTLS